MASLLHHHVKSHLPPPPRPSSEVEFLNSLLSPSLSELAKQTIPSPAYPYSHLLYRGTGPHPVDDDFRYATAQELLDDVAKAYKEEIAALADKGCTWLQLDDTNLAMIW